MNPWSIIAFVSMLGGAGLLAWSHAHAEPGETAPPTSTPDRIISKIFNFFGIGGISLALAGAVLLSTAAVTGAALDIIGVLHFGRAYPAWFPLNAVLAGLGMGLGCTWLVAAAPSRPAR
jgi:hypothetical protein